MAGRLPRHSSDARREHEHAVHAVVETIRYPNRLHARITPSKALMSGDATVAANNPKPIDRIAATTDGSCTTTAHSWTNLSLHCLKPSDKQAIKPT